MCVNGKLLSALDVMNARWDYRSRQLMLVMRMVDGSGWSIKMVDGVMSMGMMAVVEMVISCHGFLYIWYFLAFEFFEVFMDFG